ncbi:hypothetical protein LC087_18795 (plasmid) [Bacillus carboniphilus]|uniref:Uncharacterized protein n=1 Tax=Bacillus carboniphilus TaxID=86663 RepID=A0ABY9K0R4_9BACI|nr:hypothetical protein [Bacillus carboniphilus]WLR44432.1 hypothetical protein LC087_18795 [Bacillus carboniphilus]
MENKKDFLAYSLIIIPLLVSLYYSFIPEALIFPGYELAIDGYVIARTATIIFSLYLLSKIGFLLINKKS